jgi:hypothetical protein
MRPKELEGEQRPRHHRKRSYRSCLKWSLCRRGAATSVFKEGLEGQPIGVKENMKRIGDHKRL